MNINEKLDTGSLPPTSLHLGTFSHILLLLRSWNLNERDRLKNLGVDGKIKWISWEI
jgi:hypothetical protein